MGECNEIGSHKIGWRSVFPKKKLFTFFFFLIASLPFSPLFIGAEFYDVYLFTPFDAGSIFYYIRLEFSRPITAFLLCFGLE